MAYTLLTYCCPHFAVVPSSSGISTASTTAELNDAYLEHADGALKSLRREATGQHIALPSSCPRQECQGEIDTDACFETAEHDIDELSAWFEVAWDHVQHLADSYHTIPFKTRARCADKSECRQTQRQFGISKTPIYLSSYFEWWWSGFELLGEAEQLLQHAGSATEMQRVYVKINIVRACWGIGVGKMAELLDGVRYLETQSQCGWESAYVADDFQIPTRKQLVSMVSRKCWKTRMEVPVDGEQPRVCTL